MSYRLQRRALLATAAASALAGCGEGTWLGESSAPPLPGERKAVLLIEDQLSADPRIASLNITLPPPERNAAWPQSGGNAVHAMQHVTAAETIAEVWRTGIGAASGGRSLILTGPVIAGGTVYAVDADGIAVALNASDGKQLWEFEAENVEVIDRLVSGAIAVADGRAYVVAGNGMIFAVDAGTGKELWRRQLQAPMRTTPTLIAGKVLVPTDDSQLYALDGITGDILWQHAGLFEQVGMLGGASPAATDEIVVAAYGSGEVVALSLQNGQPIWNETVLRPRRTLAIGAISDIVADPVITEGRVIVAGASGEMAAFDLTRGDRLWTADVTSTQTPWVAGSFIYIITERNELVCLLLQGGRIRWISPLPTLVDPTNIDSRRIRWVGPILVSDRLLVASSEGDIYSISPYTGEVLGKAAAGGPVSVPMAVADGTVFVLTDGAKVIAFR